MACSEHDGVHALEWVFLTNSPSAVPSRDALLMKRQAGAKRDLEDVERFEPTHFDVLLLDAVRVSPQIPYP
jgi:hypothetical protein